MFNIIKGFKLNKISTVVDETPQTVFSTVSNYLKVSTVVDSLLYSVIILTENRYLSWTIFSLASLIQFEG